MGQPWVVAGLWCLLNGCPHTPIANPLGKWSVSVSYSHTHHGLFEQQCVPGPGDSENGRLFSRGSTWGRSSSAGLAGGWSSEGSSWSLALTYNPGVTRWWLSPDSGTSRLPHHGKLFPCGLSASSSAKW